MPIANESDAYALAGMLSATLGLIAAAVLWCFFVAGWARGISGRATFVAGTATAVWLGALFAGYFAPATADRLPQAAGVAELSAYAAWFGVCLRVLGIGPADLRITADPAKRILALATLAVSAGSLAAALATSIIGASAMPFADGMRWMDTARLIACITGLVLIEQVARNTRQSQQWNLKYLAVGLSILYGYGVVLYSDALLFQQRSPALAAVHGSIIALAAPFLMIATLRNRDHQLHVNLSRRLVLRTGALLATGTYLLAIGAGGYWLRVFGGDWGQVLATLFILLAVVAGVILALSRTLRERLSLALTRNVFEHKHDYRDRWLDVTQALLAEDDEDTSVAVRAVGALGNVVHAHRGAAWGRTEDDLLRPVGQLKCEWRTHFDAGDSAGIIRHFERETAPVVLSRQEAPAISPILEIHPDAHVAVPLLVGDRLYGIVLLTRPETGESIDWEDEEILVVAGRQIASFLAHEDARDALAVTRQLAAFNQTTAFVVHDIKTVVAQLSLMVGNAARHRDNPAFMDDMLKTVEHAVSRMQSLLGHLNRRRTQQHLGKEMHDLGAILRSVAATHRNRQPIPEVGPVPETARIEVARDAFEQALGHLVQNAQEATPADGTVTLDATVGNNGDIAIRIRDSGCGMTQEFADRFLFRPFESTKGVSGMGIGCWQARELIRMLGGDIDVRSAPGSGTTFTVTLPEAPTVAPASASASASASALSGGTH